MVGVQFIVDESVYLYSTVLFLQHHEKPGRHRNCCLVPVYTFTFIYNLQFRRSFQTSLCAVLYFNVLTSEPMRQRMHAVYKQETNS
jgi:hypothetical protein